MLHMQPPAERGTLLEDRRGWFGVLQAMEGLESISSSAANE